MSGKISVDDLSSIAREAHTTVVNAFMDFISIDENEEDECDLYLYVMEDGTWKVDSVSYLDDHHIYTYADVLPYSDIGELLFQLVHNSDDYNDGELLAEQLHQVET